MNASRRIGILLLWALCAPVQAQDDTPPPLAYLRQLRAPDLDDRAYLKEIKEFGPGVLLVGRSVPFDSSMGPISCFGGADPSGKDLRSAKRLAPGKVAERVKFVRRLNAVLHETQIRTVLPYASALAIVGDAETSKGFFAFYRKWREYPQLGTRPTPDPRQWIALDKKGKPIALGRDLAPSHLSPLKRYAACLSQGAWRQWMREVAKTCMDCGYDGLRLDHGLVKHCHCEECKQGFRAFLIEKYTPEAVKQYFGKNTVDAVPLTDEPKTLAGVETALFRRSLLKALLREMKQASQSPPPVLMLKGVPLPLLDYLSEEADSFLFEPGRKDSVFHVPGVEETLIVNNIYKRKSVNNIIPYKCAAGTPQQRQVAMLNQEKEPAVRRLGFAEALAFGRPALFGAPFAASDPESHRLYAEFAAKHPDLFAAASPYADVAVAYFGTQNSYPNGKRHVLQSYFAMERLARHCVPFEVVSESNVNPKVLGAYAVLIVPELFHASDALLLTFRQYMENGGTLVVSGDAFRYDDRCVKRSRTLIDKIVKRDATRKDDILATPVGSGRLVHTPKAMDEEALAQGIRQGVPTGPLQVIYRGAQHVRINARQKRTDAAADIVLHMVNYNTCAKRTSNRVIPARDILTFLRIPAGWTVFSATAHRPGGAAAERLTFTQEAGSTVLILTVPEVETYTVVQVSCRTAG